MHGSVGAQQRRGGWDAGSKPPDVQIRSVQSLQSTMTLVVNNTIAHVELLEATVIDVLNDDI